MDDRARTEQRRAHLERVIQMLVTTRLARAPDDSRGFEGVRTVDLVNAVIASYVEDRPPHLPRIEDVDFVRESVHAACVATYGAAVREKGGEVLPPPPPPHPHPHPHPIEKDDEDEENPTPPPPTTISGTSIPLPTQCGCGEPRRFLYDETVVGVRWVNRWVKRSRRFDGFDGGPRSEPSLPHMSCTSYGGWCQEQGDGVHDWEYEWGYGRW